MLKQIKIDYRQGKITYEELKQICIGHIYLLSTSHPTGNDCWPVQKEMIPKKYFDLFCECIEETSDVEGNNN